MDCVLLTFPMNNQNGIIFTIDSVAFNGPTRCVFFSSFSLLLFGFDIVFAIIGHFLGLSRSIYHELRAYNIRLLKWNKPKLTSNFLCVVRACDIWNVKSKQWTHSISYRSIENNGRVEVKSVLMFKKLNLIKSKSIALNLFDGWGEFLSHFIHCIGP